MSEQQLRWLRGLTNAALISLLLGAVLTVMSSIFSTVYSVVVGVGVVLVTLYCYRRADQKVPASREYYLWRYAPTLVFVIGPLIVLAFSVGKGDWSISGWLLFGRFSVNFLIPIACLVVIERTLKNALAEAAETPLS